ncbi:gas vesicle protein K [Sphaerisporangium sp. NPDC005289]|uniref:gas vesicle protein K n=1 Tax=Sphaerisporangium sp. NPDC005289 TaxID=3155247 RepID=UPI0033A7228B
MSRRHRDPAQPAATGAATGAGTSAGTGAGTSAGTGAGTEAAGTGAGPYREPGRSRSGPWRLDTDPETVERDLTRLVLTLVELVRQLVERQCVRRMDQGDLSDDQIETLGLTLMRLEEAMTDLCERFDLSPSDLNLDLGPLGTLLPTD